MSNEIIRVDMCTSFVVQVFESPGAEYSQLLETGSTSTSTTNGHRQKIKQTAGIVLVVDSELFRTSIPHFRTTGGSITLKSPKKDIVQERRQIEVILYLSLLLRYYLV